MQSTPAEDRWLQETLALAGVEPNHQPQGRGGRRRRQDRLPPLRITEAHRIAGRKGIRQARSMLNGEQRGNEEEEMTTSTLPRQQQGATTLPPQPKEGAAMSDTVMTIEGNLTADPVLRVTKDDDNVATLRVAVNSVRPDGKGGWVQQEAKFYDVSVWDQVSINACASLGKGDRIVVAGPVTFGEFTPVNQETGEVGKPRITRNLRAKHIGASLRFAEVSIKKNPKPEQAEGTSDEQAPGEEPF